MNPALVKHAAALVNRVVLRRDGSYLCAGNSGTYTIILPKPSAFGFGERPSCSCPAGLSGQECRHVYAVLFHRERDARQKAS